MSEATFYDLKGTSGLAHSLADQVARELGRRIVASRYRPGELIENEATLAERYEVSRTVVRDAVKILVGKGMLDVRRGIGTRVRSRRAWALLDDDVMAWHLDAPPRADFLRHLTDMRVIVEPEACRWAAQRGSEEAIDEVMSALSAMEAEEGSLEDFVIADASFHRAILHAADNEILSAMEGLIFSALLISIRLTNSDARRNADSLPFHRDVAAAIVARERLDGNLDAP